MNSEDMNIANDYLDLKNQNIVIISAFTAKGDLMNLETSLNEGLNAGLTVNEIKEILVQLYAYCGFPRSLNGINTLIKVTAERKAKGRQDEEGKDASELIDADKYQRGKKTLQKLTGVAETTLSGANAFAPVIDRFLKEHLFADIFSRDILNYFQRELITVSALICLEGTEPQLQSHLSMALNVGISEQQLKQVISIIERKIGNNEAKTATEVLVKMIELKKFKDN